MEGVLHILAILFDMYISLWIFCNVQQIYPPTLDQWCLLNDIAVIWKASFKLGERF